MNKYQKALNYLDWYCSVRHTEQQDLLQELVDRETPKKPTKNDKANHDWNSRFCPNCGRSLLFKGAGCINNDCRQKIDWSDEE